METGQCKCQSLSATYKCELCRDSGYITEKIMVPEYSSKIPIEFAVPCTNCKAIRRGGDITGVPEAYFGADLCHFDFSRYNADTTKIKKIATSFFNDYSEIWERDNKGLYIWSGTPGSGKTLLACSLAKSIMIKYDIQMRFITHADYVTGRGEDIERRKQNLEPLMEIYKSCALLVLDDLGTAKKGAYQEQCLFELLDTRMKKGLMTIITSNGMYYDLGLNDRLINRIESLCFPIHFPEESIRRLISNQKNQKFIERVLCQKPSAVLPTP